MNSSFPSSSNDGRQSSFSNTKSGVASSGPPTLPTSSFPSQASAPPPPSLAQLAHTSHHTSSMHHPIHGSGQHSSILHPSGPPPLPSSLGGPSSSSGRTSHHPLSGSILHTARASLAEGSGPSLSNSGSSFPNASNHSMGTVSSNTALMSHSNRMQPSIVPTNATNNGGTSGNQDTAEMSSSTSNAAYGLCVPPSNSPRRTLHDGSSVSQSQNTLKPPFSLCRNISQEAAKKYDYYGLGPQHQQSTANQALVSQHQQTNTNTASSISAVDSARRELRVEDALLYLDQVKQQFNHKPDIYNQFLDVMKDFKAQAINTPGVIMRVSNLFRGYPSLILGFNTFLPPGYRIRPDGSLAAAPEGVRLDQLDHPVQGLQNNTSYPSASMNAGGVLPSASNNTGNNRASGGIQPTNSNRYALPDDVGMTQSLSSLNNTSSNSNAPIHGSANPVEFDHAIHYVTTIKQRFADEPETYKEFLAILHTYQREQRSIRQVLDQVSYLFRDHPDLLREFTFFLPDAVQEQAKERLNLAAEKAQQRKDQLGWNKGRGDGYQEFVTQNASHISSNAGKRARNDGERLANLADAPSKAHKSFVDRSLHADYEDSVHSPFDDDKRRKGTEKDCETSSAMQRRSKRRPYNAKERRNNLAVHDVVIDKDEWHLFERIKRVLPSRDNWREFLKCLELYSQEVLDRNDMMSLIKNLFGRHNDLIEELDHMLCLHGDSKHMTEMWPFIPLAESDLSQCRRATPSYRGLPASYPIPPCSFRSELEHSVCNDLWVSVPTGSEDFSFKNMRKNQYEEALFKCEDERFEIDMIIDSNTSAINVLEPLAREIAVLKDQECAENKLWNYVIDRNLFRVTHLNAITRIYGDAGNQILEMLRKYPAGTIPVILRRLKQKDEEWRQARQDLNKQWKEVNEKNYHKSLDHSSFYFKQKDKKQTSSKVLLLEAKKKLETCQERERQAEARASSSAKEMTPDSHIAQEEDATESIKVESSLDQEGMKLEIITSPKQLVLALQSAHLAQYWKPHFRFKFTSIQMHRDVYGLLSFAAEKSLGTLDKEKVVKVWQSFVFPFFHLQEAWLQQKPKPWTVTLEKRKSILRAGMEVSTDFGEGIVQMYNAENQAYVVNLPIAMGYFQPNAVTVQEISDFPSNLLVLDEEEQQGDWNLQEQNRTLCIGDEHAYIFLRLYQMLQYRLERAYELCEKAKRNRFRRTINPAARALAHSSHSIKESREKDDTIGDYQAFLSKLYGLIGGSVDNSKYEDCCRSLMGSTSYFLFTMDKLVSLLLKQMQQLATDETSIELLKLFEEQNRANTNPQNAEENVKTYISKTRGVFEGDCGFRLEYQPGVLRRTPVESHPAIPALSCKNGLEQSMSKIWAPSPRVWQLEPSQWLVEPELAIEYLGSMDEENGDGTDSHTATPMETPIATPVFGSPSQNSNEDADTDSAEQTAAKDSRADNSDDEANVSCSDEEQSNKNACDLPSVPSMLGKRRNEFAQPQERSITLKKSHPESEDGSRTMHLSSDDTNVAMISKEEWVEAPTQSACHTSSDCP